MFISITFFEAAFSFLRWTVTDATTAVFSRVVDIDQLAGIKSVYYA